MSELDEWLEAAAATLQQPRHAFERERRERAALLLLRRAHAALSELRRALRTSERSDAALSADSVRDALSTLSLTRLPASVERERP